MGRGQGRKMRDEQRARKGGERGEEGRRNKPEQRSRRTGTAQDTSLRPSEKGRRAAEQDAVSKATLAALLVSKKSRERERAIRGRCTAALCATAKPA